MFIASYQLLLSVDCYVTVEFYFDIKVCMSDKKYIIWIVSRKCLIDHVSVIAC